MEINLRLKVLSGLAAIHCLFVLFGASGIRLENTGALGELITYYSCVTGAERGFGFFAPSVSPEARVVLESVDSRGIAVREELGRKGSDEAFLRISNLAGKFRGYLEGGNASLRHSMGASLAGYFFSQYPELKTVSVSVDSFRFVSMEDYQKGKRQSWVTLYKARFQK